MTKKEKIRLVSSVILSVICAVCTYFVVEAAICEFLMMPSQTTGKFYLMLAAWMSMIALALLVFTVGTICAGALGAFFAFSFRTSEKTGIRRTAKILFSVNICLIVLNVLALALLLL